ncbi:Bromodomain-containing protein [Metschnikowia bicuspidata]|uniref:Bromodomain-containing protein n=1 Tax=Metschnikowia bicuspidata TaxID=27322 RepID=A0A4P9ZC34_9ASCO|nr:Bromodomain-containing protein [Metschnikowia bicuspidata]
MSKPDTEICRLLIAQVINNSLLRLRPKKRTVEIALLGFLADLNNLAHAYKEMFHYTETYELFDVEFLENMLKNSGFSKFSSLKDDVLQLDFVPQKFQAMLTGIIVDASVKRSRALIGEVEVLRSRYTTASSEPIVKSEPSVEEVVDANDPSVAEVTVETKIVDSSANIVKPAVTEIEPKVKQDEPCLQEHEIKKPHSDLPDVFVPELKPIQVESEPQNEAQLAPSVEPEVPSETSEAVTDEVQVKEKPPNEPEALKEVKSEDPMDVDVPPEQPAEIQHVEAAETEVGGAEMPVVASDPIKRESENSDNEDGEEAPKRTRTRNQLKRSASPQSVSSPNKHKRFQNIAINLIRSIEAHRFSSPFLLPVTAPNYTNTVKEPMDLKSIMKALKLKQEPLRYEKLKELERDIMLMFANCVMFNKSTTPIVDMAREMKNEVSETFKMFEEAEMNLNQ